MEKRKDKADREKAMEEKLHAREKRRRWRKQKKMGNKKKGTRMISAENPSMSTHLEGLPNQPKDLRTPSKRKFLIKTSEEVLTYDKDFRRGFEIKVGTNVV